MVYAGQFREGCAKEVSGISGIRVGVATAVSDLCGLIRNPQQPRRRVRVLLTLGTGTKPPPCSLTLASLRAEASVLQQ